MDRKMIPHKDFPLTLIFLEGGDPRGAAPGNNSWPDRATLNNNNNNNDGYHAPSQLFPTTSHVRAHSNLPGKALIMTISTSPMGKLTLAEP